jgi:hypothetical protein
MDGLVSVYVGTLKAGEVLLLKAGESLKMYYTKRAE